MQTTKPLQATEVLEFLVTLQREELRMPSLNEVARHFGHRSPTSVQRIFAKLREQGLIEKHGHVYGLTKSATAHRGIPVLGCIAAGQPIDAIEFADVDQRVDLGDAYDSAKHFGLIVQGDSMIEAHIVSGDIAVIRRQETCNNGDIVAAVIDGEATLKRFFRDRDHVLLKPENARLKPLRVHDVEIRGVMVGLLRRF